MLAGTQRIGGYTSQQLLSGPNTGFYEVVTANVAAPTGASHRIGMARYELDEDARVVGFGWSCRAAGTTATIALDWDADIGSVATATIVSAFDLVANPSGYITASSTSPGTLDATNRIRGNVASAGSILRVIVSVTAGAPLDVVAYAILHRTGHVNTNRALD